MEQKKYGLIPLFLLAVLFLSPFFDGARSDYAVLIIETLTFVLSAFLVFSNKIKKTLLDFPIAIFSGIILFSIFFTLYFNASFNFLFLYITYILLFYIVVSVYSQQFKGYIYSGLAVVAGVISILAIAQFLKGLTPLATFPNKNLSAGYIAAVFCLVSGILFTRPVNSIKKIIYFFVLIVSGIALFISDSRGGIFAVLFGMSYLFYSKFKIRGLLVLLLTALFIFILIPEKTILHFLKTDRDIYALSRTKIWKSSLNIISERPFLGTGPGNYRLVFHKHKFKGHTMLARYGKITRFAHNEYLQIAAETGLLGLAGFLLILIVIFARCGKVPAVSCALFSLAGHALVDFNMHLPATMILGIFLAADVMSETAEENIFPEILKKRIVLILLIVMSANIFNFIVRPADAEKYKIRADKLLDQDPVLAVALYKKAVGYSPNDYEYRQTLGELYYLTGDKIASLKNLKKSLELNPKNPFALKSMGQLYFNDGDYGSALNLFLKSLEIEPHYLSARHFAARCYEYTGKPEAALSEYKNVIKIKNYFSHLTNLSSYEKALLDMDVSQTANSSGFLKLKLNRLSDAEYDFKEAIRLNSGNALAYSNLASIYFMEKKYDKALEYGKTAAYLEPNDDLHVKNLILIYEKMGDRKTADELRNKSKVLFPVPPDKRKNK